MDYLYGDSSPSPLKSNFLEFLRDALDFCSHVLEADNRIAKTKEDIRRLRADADAEMERLDTFVQTVTRTIETAPKGTADSPTARCAETLAGLAADTLRTSLGDVRARLAEAVAQAEAAEGAERAGCSKALETLLLPHDPPGAATVTMVEFVDPGTYEASLVGETEFGLEWTLDLAVPDQHLFQAQADAPLRVDRVVRELEIRAPQLSGWISKEVKVRPLRIERHVVMQLVDDDDAATVHLRAEPGSDTGFDVEAHFADGSVHVSRVGPEGDPTVGPFDLEPDDAKKLLDFAERLRAALRELRRNHLVTATFEKEEFQSIPEFHAFVQRLVGVMAPITREIDQRSLTPAELVIRRLLANDRREEIFVAKSALREKYAELPPAQRALFAPLGLEVSSGPPRRSDAPASDHTPPLRTELAPSQPPPPAPSLPSLPSLSTLPSSPSIPSLAAFVEESGARVSEPPEANGSKTSLKATLKRILALAKKGNTVDAYRGYAALFSSPEFAEFRPEDRRQALRIMVLAKSTPPATEAVISAHRAAVARAAELVDTFGDPADYEILGVAQLFLDEEDAARATFAKALSIERERNPQSELCGALMRRLSQTAPARRGASREEE